MGEFLKGFAMVTGHNVESLYVPVTMANRHNGEFIWTSHNGNDRLSHNGKKIMAAYAMVQKDFKF